MIRFVSLKMPALALGALALTFSAGVSAVSASAQSSYDGYCYSKKEDVAGKNAAIGAAAGAVAGGLFGKKEKKTKSAVIGAAIGAGAGYVVGKNSKEKIRCSKGVYYVYNKGYYEPAPAEEGFRVVFFEQRPDKVDAYVITKGKMVPYRGR